MRRMFLFLGVTAWLSGCAVFEYLWLVPSAHGSVKFDPKYSNDEVLDKFVQIARPELRWFNQPRENNRDVDEGVTAIGPYQESNVAGYSAHAEIDRAKHVLSFVVKGAGPYYMPLPVDEVVHKIFCQLSPRLRKKTAGMAE